MISKSDIQFITNQQKLRILNIKTLTSKLTEDKSRKDRLKEQLCILCYYISSMHGNCSTSSNCEACEVKVDYAHTNVDKYCKKCAKEYKLCKHCGSKINIKMK